MFDWNFFVWKKNLTEKSLWLWYSDSSNSHSSNSHRSNSHRSNSHSSNGDSSNGDCSNGDSSNSESSNIDSSNSESSNSFFLCFISLHVHVYIQGCSMVDVYNKFCVEVVWRGCCAIMLFPYLLPPFVVIKCLVRSSTDLSSLS